MLYTNGPKTGKKNCFIHETRLPLNLPFNQFQHHICRYCQSRLQKLADANFQLSLREQTITISVVPQIQEKVASPGKNGNARKKQRVPKEAN